MLYVLKVTTYKSPLEERGCTTMHIRRVKTNATGDFSYVDDLNPIFMKEMYNAKEISYEFKDK